MRLVLALALLLAAPAAAHADSIVYIDQGNVWSAHPDGTGKVQLTAGGGWHSPTQADDGTLAAVQGTGPISVMARDGRLLRTIATPPARSGDGGTFAPNPVELSFSPDATKIAYAYVANSCPVASTCGSIQRSTFYTDAAGPTPVETYGNQFGVSDPEWVTNSAHARVRRLRQPGVDRRPRAGRLLADAVDGSRTATWATASSPATARGSR